MLFLISFIINLFSKIKFSKRTQKQKRIILESIATAFNLLAIYTLIYIPEDVNSFDWIMTSIICWACGILFLSIGYQICKEEKK